jgi:4-amino-4-deoxy-L-arabinose transferase-like glycosyltransferase
MNRTKIFSILVLILLLGGVLRFAKLSSIPPSLTWDEAAWGYNAYAIGTTGKDEFGKLPISYLESFGDYKPPLYAFVSILPVKLFGLNEFSTRFASAFFGTATIAVTYFLVLELFKCNASGNTSKKLESKGKDINIDIIQLALLSSLFLALSPWHINLSRAAFEANVATFFISSGVLFFLKGIRKNGWYLIASSVLFVFSLYTFNSARIVVPLLLFVFLFAFRNRLWILKKQMFTALFVGIILCIPYFHFLSSPQAKLRFNEVNIFSDPSIIVRSNEAMENDRIWWCKDVDSKQCDIPIWSKVINNRRIGYFREYVKHYLDNVKPSFLFYSGDGNPKFSTQDVGLLYFIEAIFLIVGILFIFKQKKGYYWIVPVWFLFSIIPAATARETPHSLRIASAIPTLQIVSAYGLLIIVSTVKNRFKQKWLTVFLVLCIILIYLGNAAYYLHGYYIHYAREYSGEWQYGYKELFEFTEKNKNDYDKMIVTTELGRPYIYFLFFNKILPSEFNKNSDIQREVFGFVHVNSVGKYIFVKNPASYNSDGKRILIADISKNLPQGIVPIKTIKLLNGDPILTVYEK